jgi:hypothetical protein
MASGAALALKHSPSASGIATLKKIGFRKEKCDQVLFSTECHNSHQYAGELDERTRVPRPFGDEVQANVRTEAFVHPKFAEAE